VTADGGRSGARAALARAPFAPRGLRAMPPRVHRAAWAFAAIVLAGLALRPRFGDELVLTRYTGYVMPWLLAGLLPGAAWAWRARRRALAAVLGVSAAAIAVAHAPLFRPRPAIAAPAAGTLRVMSYNTWSRNGDARRIAGVIRAQAPDVLLLQEIPPPVFERLVDALRDLYGGSTVHFTYEPELQQAVLSRHPLEPRASLADKGQAQHVVVRSPAGPIAVFNVHPLRTGGWRHRYRQIAALLEEDVLPERSPVILGGDFNVNDRAELYRLVASRLENAHDAAGFGFGFTYPAAVRVLAALPAPPMARIDHLFFSAQLVALRAGTLADSGGSDHRPVFAVLAPRQPVSGEPRRGTAQHGTWPPPSTSTPSVAARGSALTAIPATPRGTRRRARPGRSPGGPRRGRARRTERGGTQDEGGLLP